LSLHEKEGHMSVTDIAITAKRATLSLQSLPEEQRLMALEAIALALTHNMSAILGENKKDLEEARQNNLSAAIDREVCSGTC
jgi:gamma-glutamyl phosphate reductase